MAIAIDLRTATDHFPGIGRYAVSLMQELSRLRGGSQKFILIHDATRPARWDLRSLGSERMTMVNIPISPFSIRQQWIIPRHLKTCQASLYHSLYYMMPYRPGVATVVTVYDLIPLMVPHHTPLKVRLLFHMMLWLALRTARQVIVISETARRSLLARFDLPAEKVTAIPLAMDPRFQPQRPQAVEALRNRLALGGPYVLYLGTNKPHKNLVRLVEAWERLQPTPASLVIAGFWDPRYPEAREKVKTLSLENAVRFLGPVAEEDLPALYCGASLFVFPSECEGFGLPVLEAMACGTPVITSNVSAMPEVAGQSALLVNPYDVAGLAQAMRQVLQTPSLREDLVRRGLQRVKDFSWKRCATATLDVYAQAMGR
ncbi:MAG: glycosyltransferase family 4 protein [Desulfobacterales bacterium]|nr:MAG: glycosyltransferase family 4 protein [Desulfobacterales bacterium]